MFLLVDKEYIVRDAATYQDSLCPDRLTNDTLTLVEFEGNKIVFVGDEYDPLEKRIIKRPENYPTPTPEEQAEIQIQAEMRRQAVAALKTRGVLPADYVDKKDVPKEPVTRETI